MLKTLWITLLIVTGFAFAQEPNVELILDLSGSMWLELESGESKIDAAKTALKDIIDSLEDDTNIGLRVYGATVSGIDADACTDSQQILPITQLDKNELISMINSANPKGGTPIVYALNEAVKDFASIANTSPKTIVLVTDGQESCGQNLEVAIENLRANGIDLQVIGFGLSERASQAFDGLDFVNTFDRVQLTTALSETILDLRPVEAEVTTQTNITEITDYDVNVDISVTSNDDTTDASEESTNTANPTDEYGVNITVTTTPNILSIVDIAGPNQLVYNAPPTTYNLNWQGSPIYPLTVNLRDIDCAFDLQEGACIFKSNPIESSLNPIPLGITCSSRVGNEGNSGYWTHEIQLVDAAGNESSPFVLEIRCVP